MKKRGFGQGKWNGLGGKIRDGEPVEAAAAREVAEEAGVAARQEHLEKTALLKFRSARADLNWDVHVFILRAWDGEPRETEEMSPRWFPFSKIPYGEMWADDKHWLPEILAGRRIEAEFVFDEKDPSSFLNFSVRDRTSFS